MDNEKQQKLIEFKNKQRDRKNAIRKLQTTTTHESDGLAISPQVKKTDNGYDHDC